MLRPALVMVGLVLTLGPLAACGSGGGSSQSSSSGSGGATTGGTLGLASDQPRNDNSFGQATYTGAMEAAQKYGLKLQVVDNLAGKTTDTRNALNNLARTSDLVLEAASSTSDAEVAAVANQYPKTSFASVALARKGAPNIYWAVQDWYPLGYLAGVVAARSSHSHVVGFVGGGEIPPTVRGSAGFADGAKAIDGSIKVLNTITGSFIDPSKGKDATAAQIAQGADIIYSFLDAAHAGAVQAAQESGKGVKVLGVISPKCDASQGLDIGDTFLRQDQLVFNLVSDWVNHTQKTQFYALEHPNASGFAFCSGAGSSELQAELQKVTGDFNSGALKVPPMGS